MSKPNFYLVCGISGGGKTTLTERIVKKNPHLVIYDVDKYYEMINGDECDRSHWFEVWIKLYQDMHQSMLDGQDIILTSNALTVSQRRQFIEWFPDFNHHCLWVTAPKNRCFEGNKQRKRHVPDDKLEAQWNRMEFPNASEPDWDTIAQITNLWDGENYIIFDLKGDIQKLIKI